MPSRPASPPTLLVLGATGFVGRHVCAASAAAGQQVLAVARSPLPGLAAHRFLSFDLARTPADEVARVLREERVDVVVNSIGSIWGAPPEEMTERCTAPTLRLLEALRLLDEPPRLVQLGSVLEYGDPPATAYGRAKLAAARAVLEADARGEVRALVLRIANAAGPGTPDISLLGQVAARLREAAAEGREAVVELNALLAHRDYVDVRDVADAVVAAATSSARGQIVGIGRGEAVPVRSLVTELIRVSGVPARVVEREAPTTAPGTDDWIQVDTGPARGLLGWRAGRSLESALRAFWTDAQRSPLPAGP
ncbi:nucleoside-diphosphate-sugar epimerase [Streptomyces sp. HB202]|uniref:NAD-dependent epimerase/dehydratase family protein n=1 Tax=Streptomyces globisporus TaxID=1908 RepID=UPI000E2DC257|nr:NAD-dependent epimerase/dehydratase family protein [Streptomyces sp. HB202]RDL08449.1 nucleoside-diphosphate-sugar epimerase [Streptomyces sp. HB202]WSU80743.1 NAD-dependent epimerase/dehydratase family protein [Streptomyces globisporus]